jgi:hypothetical protein
MRFTQRLLNTYACCSLCMILSLSATAAGDTHPKLKVWLETARTEYKFCADIPVYLFVVNEDSAPVKVPYVDEAEREALRLDLISSDGDSLEFTGLNAISRDSVPILPRDTVMFTVDLQDRYSRGGYHTDYPPNIPVG